MNVALITAFVAFMLIPMSTAWIIALGKAPVRIAYRQLIAALTIEAVLAVAIHVWFYSTLSRVDVFGVFGYGLIYAIALVTNSSVIAHAIEYINSNHDEIEPPKAPKLTKFKNRNLR